jgi:hypothetical protein
MRRHCEGEQQAGVPVAVAEQVSPGRVHSLHTPPEHDAPPQQSLSALHVDPRGRHAQRPEEHSIEPQQSAEVAHVAFAAAHAHRPPVQAAPLQHSDAEPHAEPERLQHVPDVPPVPLQDTDAPVLPGQQRTEVEQVMPGVAHIEPVPPSPPPIAVAHIPLRHSCPAGQSVLVTHVEPRAQRPMRHTCVPQHCWSPVHVPLSERQQRLVPRTSPHIVPVTHIGMPPGIHDSPAGTGVDDPLLHVPPVHVSPMQQLADVIHAVPAPLHRLHKPPTH